MTKNHIRDIIQWDVKSWSVALNYWEKVVDWPNVQNALELGGREGGLSLWLAGHGVKTICSDLSEVEKKAFPLHRKYGVDQYITYQDIDATNIPYENYFDIIVFKSILGGIGRGNSHEKQKKSFQQIYKALKPGGKLLFAENLVASPVHQHLRKRYIKWAGYWRYVTLEEMKDFLQEFSDYELKQTGVMAAFGRSESQRYLLAGVDQLILNKFSPAHWKYIGYGIAIK